MKAVNPDYWRKRVEEKKSKHQNCEYEQRMFVLATTAKLKRELKKEKVMTAADNTRYWTGLIHEHRLRMEGAVENALHKIGDDNNWSPGAFPPMFLRADITAMRKLD